MSIIKKDATPEFVQSLIENTTNEAPESALGADKGDYSGAPSLRYSHKKTADDDKKAKEEAEAKAKEEQLAKEKADAEAKAAEAEAEKVAKEKAEAEQKAKEESEAKATADAEAKAKADAEAKAKEEAEAKAKADAEAEQKAKEQAEAERVAKEKAEADAKAAAADAEAKAKAEAETKAKEEAEKEAKAKEQAEADAKAKAEAEAQAKAKADAEQKAKEEAEAKAKADAEAEAKQAAIEAEAKKSMGTDQNSTLIDTSNDTQKKKSEATVSTANVDSDGVSHYDGTDNKNNVIVQFNGALNSALVVQENNSGELSTHFKYRAKNTYISYANGNIGGPWGGGRLAENDSQPYHVMNIDNYEFGLGVVNNAGGTQKNSTTVKLAQTQPDGSVEITLGLPAFAQSQKPSEWFAISLADLSNKDIFNVKDFTDNFVVGFELFGDGEVTSNFMAEFAYSPDYITLATNMAGYGGQKVYQALPLSPSVKNQSRPFQGYVGILESKEVMTATFPNNPIIYWPESTYTSASSVKYAMAYGNFTVRMYATRRVTGETYEIKFPLKVNFNPK